MSLNLWWEDRPAERYWMEITDRTDVGADLLAPQRDGVGKENWSYTLVTETRPGDVVFHWHKKLAGKPGIVGWSRVTGPLSIGTISWRAHGTRGRARGVPTVGASWTMQCGGLVPLEVPVTIDDLRGLEPALRKVFDELQARVRGALYFPFTFYGSRELRAAQAYLTKFPDALVKAIPGLSAVLAPDDAPAASDASPGGSTAVRIAVGPGRLQDPALRKAIEDWAVERTSHYYRDLGATRIEVIGKPFDLIVWGLGPVRHVEVKGSSVEAVAVELTTNEVTHARNYGHTDLVVVDRIEWARDAGGGYSTRGGRLRVWESWQPSDADLSITRYRYDMPTGNRYPAS